ncbi:helix-turn-helix transcriptional regulator [Amycolatopsis azurea]
MRSTREMHRLTAVFLAGDTKARFHAGDLRRATKVHNRRLYPMLARLLERGWITNGCDEPSSDEPSPQPYYVLTDIGRRELNRP